MIKSYDINDYLKDDKELQKAVIRELFKEITTQQDKIDTYQISENEANEIIAELQAYKDVNEDFKKAYVELKAENEQLKNCLQEIKETIKSIEKDSINGLNNSASFSKNSEFSSIQNKANGCIKLITKAEEE